jgi:DNA-3-methyladenine glycosylase
MILEPFPVSFFKRPNVVQLAEELLGNILCSSIDGELTAGIIVETEAYAGITDQASHAYGGRRTKRTETMYAEAGVAYVYLCYGMYSLLNIVTHDAGIPEVILIRALEPIAGIEVMERRRGNPTKATRLTAGPGLLTQALGIDCTMNGRALSTDWLWVAAGPSVISPEAVIRSPRVGIPYANEDRLLPYRFRIESNRWTSPAK